MGHAREVLATLLFHHSTMDCVNDHIYWAPGWSKERAYKRARMTSVVTQRTLVWGKLRLEKVPTVPVGQ